MSVIPVMFPPGRARLSTSPTAIGSDTLKKTMGIVLVAFLAARAAGVVTSSEHVNLETDQFFCQRREPVKFIISVAIPR